MSKKVVTRTAVFERSDRPGRWTYDRGPIGGGKKEFFKSKDEATIAMVEAVNNFNNGLIVAPIKITTAQAGFDVFIVGQEHRKDDSDISETYFDDLKRSVEFCLTIKLDGKTIAKHDINALMQQQNRDEVGRALMNGIKAEGKSKATAEKRVKFLKMFLNFAVTKGWGMVNPLDKLSLGMSSEVSDRAPRIQPEIVQSVVAALDGESLLHKAMVLTAISTGMRQGELRALPWSNVNFEDCRIKIDRAVKHGNVAKIGDTKTKRGRRGVPVPEAVISVLRELRVASKFSTDSDWVFANNAGSVQLKKVFPQILKRVCDRAGVPVMLWGDFRHFFASVQISSLGEDWGEVAALMGHANSAFTYRQYGHYVRNVEKQKQVTSATAAAMGI